MPPNKTGGKNYKKGKHTDDEPVMFEKLPDQMYGRVIRLLGGCNAIVYCNDNRERLCHIRGSMRKKVWLATGDIVLISIRDMTRFGENVNVDRGDICAKYDPRLFAKLRYTDKSINEKLFTVIEKTETSGIGKTNKGTTDDDFGFVFDSAENQVVDGEEDKSESDVDESMRPVDRAAQRRAMMLQNENDDINIDDI
jgi:translation initiation factor 1A